MRFMITIRVSRAIIPYLLERWSRGERRYRPAACPRAKPKWRVCGRAVCR